MLLATALAIPGVAMPPRAPAAPPTPTCPGAACSCTAALDTLAATLEADYAGYVLEVVGRKEAAYRRHLAEARTRAEGAQGAACERVLQSFLDFFPDGHLFVGNAPGLTGADSARLAGEARTLPWTLDGAIAHFDARAGALDPVEGLWYDGDDLAVAIVADTDGDSAPGGGGERCFAAVVVAGAPPGWKEGQVKAELTRLPDSSYDAVVWGRAHQPQHPYVHERGSAGGGRLRRDGLLLQMPPTLWGKAYPVPPALAGQVDPSDPRRPTARRVDDATLAIAIPSMSPEDAPALANLVLQQRRTLLTVPNLVIDLRGDEGGSSRVPDVLMPYLAGPSRGPARYLPDDRPAVLSSPDNIRYFEAESWAPAGLVDSLRAHPGRLVPFSYGGDGEEDAPPPAATPLPRRVGVVTDEGTVSAAEAFLLRAERFPKVTMFGAPTGGSIDYQTVTIVDFGCPEWGFYLGYPVIAGSVDLPTGSANHTGIVPDVPYGGPDPVGFAAKYLERGAGPGG